MIDLYLIPGAGMSPAEYRFLSTALAQNRVRLKVFPVRGLDGRSLPHSSIEEIVVEYLAALESDRSNGPCALAGHSFGGSIAFEMARKLELERQQVCLYMLDSLLTSPRQYRLAGKREDGADEKTDDAAVTAVPTTARDTNLTTRSAALVHKTLLMQAQLAENFVPSGIFAGDVNLFVAEDGPIAKLHLPEVLEQYELWLKNPPICHTVAGGHLSMLHHEHVTSLSSALTASLSGTLAEPPTSTVPKR